MRRLLISGLTLKYPINSLNEVSGLCDFRWSLLLGSRSLRHRSLSQVGLRALSQHADERLRCDGVWRKAGSKHAVALIA